MSPSHFRCNGAARLSIVAVLTVLFAPSITFAQSFKLKPGAWEITSQSDATLPAEMLAKMPPQAQEMMKQKMAEAAKNRTPTRTCVTPNDEDYRRAFLNRMSEREIKCTLTEPSRSGSTYTWRASCVGTIADNQSLKMDSEHAFTYDGGNDWSHTSKTVSSGIPGASPTPRTSQSKGHYLGADCKAFGALTFEERMKEAEARGRAPGRPVIKVPQ